MIFLVLLALLVLLVLPVLPAFLALLAAPPQRAKFVRRVVGAQENSLRSLLSVNEEGVYRSATT